MQGNIATNTCPNCGHQIDNNYCPECGQATTLHDETVKGLFAEFVKHFFYYDSKFWRTMKTLWFRPGALTIAYWNRERMKYIPPLALYLSISGLYFLVFFLVKANTVVPITPQAQLKADSVARAQHTAKEANINPVAKKIGRMNDPRVAKEVTERAWHNFPKFFFFMIPVMAFMLWLFFLRRKGLSIVHHIIFSLHWHTFYFSTFIFHFITNMFQKWATSTFHALYSIIELVLILVGIIYFFVAIKKVYNIHNGRAVLYSVIMFFAYFIILVIAILAYVVFTLSIMK